MKRLLLLFLTVVAAAMQLPAQVLLYYGGGRIENGYGSNGQILTSYVVFQPAMLTPYKNNQITHVRIGMKGSAKSVTLYFKNSQRDSKPLYTQSIGTLSEGWNDIELTTPFNITATKSIAIGFKATLEASGAIGYDSEKVSDGDFIYLNQTSKWTSTGGTLCLQALVEGDQMPVNELAIGRLADQTAAYDAETVTFSSTVRNMGANDVDGYSLRYTLDGADEQVVQVAHAVAVNAIDTFRFEVPSTVVGVHALKLWIDQVNGAPDGFTDNNTVEARLTVRDQRFARRVVCEENTGLWCGWCPRGMVGLELMKERYPGRFIAVSVHGGDVLEIGRSEDYNYGKFTDSQAGAPSCVVNRRMSGDPFYDIETLYRLETTAENHVAYTMEARWNTDSTAIETTSHYFTDVDMTDAQYYAAFIVTEDSVSGYSQTNYYANTPTQEFYGWEKKDEHTTDCYFNDLARGIFSNYDGDPCSAAELKANQVYDYSYDVPLPPTVQDRRHVHVVGLLIDHKTGYVANAFSVAPDRSLAEELGISSQRQVPSHVQGTFGLQGRRVSGPQSGIVIERTVGADGKVVTRKTIKTL